MKRLLVIPIMFLYLVAVSGVMIHLHYCGTTLESWTVYDKADGCGEGSCGEESDKSDDCCKDEVITAKITQDQQNSPAIKLMLHAFDMAVPAQHYVATGAVVLADANPGSIKKANAPPGRWQSIPLYRLYSSYTYYG